MPSSWVFKFNITVYVLKNRNNYTVNSNKINNFMLLNARTSDNVLEDLICSAKLPSIGPIKRLSRHDNLLIFVGTCIKNIRYDYCSDVIRMGDRGPGLGNSVIVHAHSTHVTVLCLYTLTVELHGRDNWIDRYRCLCFVSEKKRDGDTNVTAVEF